MKRLSILSVGMLLAFSAQSQTMEQALKTAIETNPMLRAASQQLEVKKFEYEAAHGNYLPEVNLNADAGRIYKDNKDNSNDVNKMSLTVSQLIWDGGNTISDIRRTGAEAKAAEYAYLQNKDKLAIDVVEAYANVVRSYSVVNLLKRNMDKHQEIYLKIKKRADQGISSIADLYQAESRLLSVEKNTFIAQNNLADSETKFVQLVGELPKNLKLSDINETLLPKTFDESLNRAIKQNKSFAISEFNLNAAKHQHDQQKSNFLPNLSLDINRQWSNDSAKTSQDSNETIIMVRASYNLFNGFEDSNRAKAAATQISKLKFERDDLMRNVEQSIKLSLSSIDALTKQNNALIKLKSQTASVVTSYEKQYEIGKRTLLDLLNAHDETFAAERDYINTNIDLYISKWRLLNVTGEVAQAFDM